MSSPAITVFGVIALTFMMVMYALERRHPRFVLAFAVGCLLSSAYRFVEELGPSAWWSWSGQEWLPDVTWESERAGRRIKRPSLGLTQNHHR